MRRDLRGLPAAMLGQVVDDAFVEDGDPQQDRVGEVEFALVLPSRARAPSTSASMACISVIASSPSLSRSMNPAPLRM
ncbi:hypothetical protein KO481_10790 [Nocardia sp. NEAU-G5]|uniref:Uncharacterized protein n=1 Tax=Nocardia albiluteola TaxID=2842303 RepID=A0ABS6AYC8_9NOCA|nr:hypothetical protein [Nocardia albiluteola]MBU3062009.1 hypothetical protein [Nocardia albiluteola]